MSDATQTPEIFRQAPAGRVVLWTGEVAALAGVTPMTITRWVKAGKVKASTISPGGNRRFWPSDVEAMLIELGRPVPAWLAGATAAPIVYVLISHEGWGEGVLVRGVFADRAAAEGRAAEIREAEASHTQVLETEVIGAQP